LTFKATSHRLAQARLSGLEEIEALRRTEPIRSILVPRSIGAALNGTNPNTTFPHTLAAPQIAAFISGHFLTVSRRSAAGVDVEQLEGVEEVWAICFRRRRPGWRLLGRWLEPSKFVGLGLYDRLDLGGAQYNKRAQEVIAQWESIFPGLDPLRGSHVGDYVGGVFRDVDEKED
jgi:hypothetical protein